MIESLSEVCGDRLANLWLRSQHNYCLVLHVHACFDISPARSLDVSLQESAALPSRACLAVLILTYQRYALIIVQVS